MSEKIYQIVANVFNVDISKINDETSPENLEQWDSFNFYVLLDEIENGFNIKSEKFIKDIGFISECVKATLLRQMKYQHPVAILMDKVMSIQKQQNKENSQALSHFNFEELQKLLGKKDDPKTPKR